VPLSTPISVRAATCQYHASTSCSCAWVGGGARGERRGWSSSGSC
jgi:hypothetical protein